MDRDKVLACQTCDGFDLFRNGPSGPVVPIHVNRVSGSDGVQLTLSGSLSRTASIDQWHEFTLDGDIADRGVSPTPDGITQT